MLKSILVTLLLLGVPVVAQTATVSGTLHDDSGIPVAGASITLSGGASATSGATGVFSVTVPTGIYTVNIEPPTTALAPHRLIDVVVTSATNLGIVTLQPGLVLSGTVLSSSGAAVINGDIDVFDQATGTKLFTPNDNTTAAGTFSVIVPSGAFKVRAEPAAGVLLVAQLVENVSVTGPTNMGAITLPQGVALTGTVVQSPTMSPLVDVDLDVFDLTLGQPVQTPNDETNALGAFSVVVPTGTMRVTFSPAAGTPVVGARITTNVTANLNMGTVALDAGFLLTGTVVDGTGPVAGADIDVVSTLGDVLVFTPHDTTDALGSFSVAVPAGAYDVRAYPESTTLVPGRYATQPVNANTALGTLTLANGVALSGTVTSTGGVPQIGTRIDVTDSSGNEVLLTQNTTNGQGAYSVLVPNGTHTVDFVTAKASLYQDQSVTGVVVAGATTLNAQLPPVAMLCFLQASPGQTSINFGNPIGVDAVIYNPSASLQWFDASLVIIDPSGVSTPVTPTIPLAFLPGQFFVLTFLPLSLPALNTSFSGLPFELRLTLTDTNTGAPLDTDGFTMIFD